MAESSRGTQPAEAAADDRLDSWKDIAAYLKRDVTTAQRWEKREGMPVRRHVHDKLGSVYAFRSELDAWVRGRHPSPTSDEDGHEPRGEPVASDTSPVIPPPRRRSFVVWMAVAAAFLGTAVATWWALDRRDYFWRDPLAAAQFQSVTDFGGSERAAVVSRDGRFVAFLSDRDGRTDVWLTQIGAGRFYNLTGGHAPELVNPSVRMLGFSPDGTLVTFWTRSNDRDISIWAVPTLGGQPRPYLERVAELAWSGDGSRLVYHTAEPGDPMFVKEPGATGQGTRIFLAPEGLHAHFPTWSPDADFIYFVQGSLPDAMDIWRIRPDGGTAERITNHNANVSYPVFLDQRTLMYLATDADGSGPWLHSMDIDRRVPHRLGTGVGRYTSLAASADGGGLVATLANPNGTLWRVAVDVETPSQPMPIALTTGRGFSPRLGPGYLLYASSKGPTDALWKVVGGAASELWSAPDARIIGGPEISPDGQRIAFSVQQGQRTLLYAMNADATDVRVVTDSLELRGTPAWTRDGQSITSAANVDGRPHLFRISLTGAAAQLVAEYSVDPVWSPGGDFFLYSGADIGTTFPLKASTADGRPYAIPNLTLTRGARRLRFFGGNHALVMMRGEIQHKDLWSIDLDTGAERRLTNLPPDFNVRDFDVSPDGREIVLERVQDHSGVVLIDLRPHE